MKKCKNNKLFKLEYKNPLLENKTALFIGSSKSGFVFEKILIKKFLNK